jgi:type III pantothenate kinase
MRRSSDREIDYLLVDISNSYTKIAASTKTKISPPFRIPTRRLTQIAIRKLIRRHAARTLVVSSVVPSKTSVVEKAAGKRHVLCLSSSIALGIGVDYPHPQTIGADRLANAAGVAALYGCPAIVVDFGTAVTFDVVSPARSYIGGVIAPGLEVMTRYLYQRTALLPELDLAQPRSAIGKSTRTAMLSGAVFGYAGLVKEILQRIRREMPSKRRPMIVATGGYAKLIATQVPEVQVVDENLTLEGLRVVANLNIA